MSGFSISTNIFSLNAQRNLAKTQSSLQTSLSRLSSGYRINSAKDDAAGLAIADRMTSQIRGLNQAVRNANDGISLAQTAEGALQKSTDALQRIRELAVQSANDINSDSDRTSLQKEVNQLKAEINRIADTTSFNGKSILDGTFSSAKFHVGFEMDQTINVSIGNSRSDALGDYQGEGIATSVGAATRFVDGTLTVNGPEGSKDITITAATSTAKSIAAQVNDETSNTGVTATAKTQTTLTASNDNFSFELSGDNATAINISATVTNGDLTGLAQSINDHVAETGITAAIDGNEIVLEHSTGETINIDTITTSSGAGTLTVGGTGFVDGNDVIVEGQVTLHSDKAFNVADTGTFTTAATVNGELEDVSSVDISSQSGSNDALVVIDKALAYIDSMRSDLGAVQNRFESTIGNLMNVSENISAARSRVQDADFAAETATLAKTQILQQAGIAMLAQSKQMPQMVLQLLQ